MKKYIIFMFIVLISSCGRQEKIDVSGVLMQAANKIQDRPIRHCSGISSFDDEIDCPTFTSKVNYLADSIKAFKYTKSGTSEYYDVGITEYKINTKNEYDCKKMQRYTYSLNVENNNFKLNEYVFVNVDNVHVITIFFVNDEIREIKIKDDIYINDFINRPAGYKKFLQKYQTIKTAYFE